MGDIYVVFCERDLPDKEKYDGYMTQGIVMETTLDRSGIDDANEKIKSLNGQYGKTRIAKLVFIDAEGEE